MFSFSTYLAMASGTYPEIEAVRASMEHRDNEIKKLIAENKKLTADNKKLIADKKESSCCGNSTAST